MTKFYYYQNASRRIKSGEYEFAFDPIEQFGGSWVGVLKLEDAGAQAEIAKISARLGIKEITQDEYDTQLKKKLTFNRHSANIPTLPQPQGSLNQHAGVVVKNRTAPSTPVDDRPSSDDAITIGKADFIDPIMGRSAAKNAKFVRSWQ